MDPASGPTRARWLTSCLSRARAANKPGARRWWKRKGMAMHATGGPPDLYARLGGEPVLASVVDDFYLRVTRDALVAPLFSRIDMPALRLHQRLFLNTVLDAPQEPTRAYLRAAHRDMHITPRQFDTVVGHLRAALQQAEVPASVVAELMLAVEQYADDIIGR